MKKAKDLNKRSEMREIVSFAMFPLGLMFASTTFNTIINFYMSDVLKLSLGLVSIVALMTKICESVLCPIAGQIVERTRTKFGKCRPYLLWLPIPIAVAGALTFFPINFPDSWNIMVDGVSIGNAGNFAFVLIMNMVYLTLNLLMEVPKDSLLPLVFPQKDLRVRAVSFSQTIGSLGTILPSVLIWTVIGLLGNGQKDTTDMGYFLATLVFFLFGSSIILVSFFGIKEKVYIPPKKTKASKHFKEVLSDSRMRILLVCAFMSGMINVGAIFLPYFAKWNCFGILPMDQINSFLEGILGKNPHIDAVAILPTLLSVMSGISYMLSMLLVPIFTKRMSKKTLWIATSLIGAVANVVVYIIGIYILPYNTIGGLALYSLLRFFTNFPIGMSTVIIVSLIADVTDSMEMRTGNRLEATSYSLRGFLYKISIGIFHWVVLQIVDGLGYHVETMEKIAKDGTDHLVIPLIESTTVSNIINGVDYTVLLNGIFFMLTVFGSFGLILQALPMFFLKFDESEIGEKLVAYREQKRLEREREAQAELDEALAKANEEVEVKS